MVEQSPILLFDGVCNLCDQTVQFVLKNNSQQNVQFSSLQSEFGQEILSKYQLPTEDFQTLILLENNQIFTYSDAALKLCAHLDTPWNWLKIGLIIPKFIRDSVYKFVSNNRYRLMGKKEQCMIPDPAYKKRFI